MVETLERPARADGSPARRPAAVPSLGKRIGYVGLAPIACMVLIRLATLGMYPLVDPTESRYAEMARTMVATGNWVTPYIHFEHEMPFWGKPPLSVWLTATGIAVGGVNEFAARLPALLLGIAIGWLVYHLAAVQSGRGEGVLAVTILGGTALFFVMAGAVAVDQSMTLGTTLALTSFWLALRSSSRAWGYLFFIGLAIGLLAKGPVAVVLTGMPIFLWIAIRGARGEVWRRLPWITGTLLMLALSVPWYFLAEYRTPGFLHYFLIGEHWQRFTQSGWEGDLYGAGRAHPRGTIWLFWLLAGLPWSPVFCYWLASAVTRKQGSQLFSSGDGWRLYLLLWMLAPLLLFTLSANVIWTYVLPGMPGFALLLAAWLWPTPSSTAAPLRRVLFSPWLNSAGAILFLGLVIASRFPVPVVIPTQAPLVQAYYSQRSGREEGLFYEERNLFSAFFYSRGEAQCLSTPEELTTALHRPARDFFAVRTEVWATWGAFSELQKQFEMKGSYGNFVLVQAVKTEGDAPNWR